MKNYKIDEKCTLLEALKKIFPDSSNTTLRNFLEKRRVYVDNVLGINAKEIIEKDKIISIYPRSLTSPTLLLRLKSVDIG